MPKTRPTPLVRTVSGTHAAALAAAVVVCVGACLALAAKKPRKIIVPHPDGSRTPPVHLMQLFDHDGELIDVAKDPSGQPFSARVTCNKCHEYENINDGWHFNAAETNIAPGRNGEPWILTDRSTGTQIPLSSRKWPGTFRPEEMKISRWRFTQIFGRQMPGGGIGEAESEGDIFRSDQSGPLEINCLGCHSAHGDQDQSAWAVNVGRYNYKWAAVAASGLARVTGDVSTFPPDAEDVGVRDPDHREYRYMQVKYDAGRFDGDKKVFIDLRRDPPAGRCYFCHSTTWTGEDHIVRGYEGEKSPGKTITTLTCRGCHIGDGSGQAKGLPGRLGAPQPRHAGLPTTHLKKLSCTACHSGPWPGRRAGRVRTSRSHGLGIHGPHTADPVLPYIASPVFMKGHDGKIAPHHALWPAYWGRLKGEKVRPIPIAEVAEAGEDILPEQKKGPKPKKYDPPTPDQIAATLAKLAEDAEAPEPVYISGGKLYRRGGDGKLTGSDHAAAKPYAWPFAHGVRPAGQSLGAMDPSGCSDCHGTDSPIFFGEVLAEAPAPVGAAQVKKMYELLGEDGTHWRLFAMSFVFRPMLKIVAFACAALILAIIALYGFGALKAVLARFASWTDRS